MERRRGHHDQKTSPIERMDEGLEDSPCTEPRAGSKSRDSVKVKSICLFAAAILLLSTWRRWNMQTKEREEGKWACEGKLGNGAA
jgi:hypothetical protein